MYYPWWGRSFLAMWNCKWKELWSSGGCCSPWAVCLRVPASTSISILPFRLKCGWANPSNQQCIGTCDCFRLYSKAFSPSCACKSQNSSLFLWLGFSMKMEAARGSSSSEWTVALMSGESSVQSVELVQHTLVKGESVLNNTEQICDNAQSSAPDGFGRGLAKLSGVVRGSPVSCWKIWWISAYLMLLAHN